MDRHIITGYVLWVVLVGMLALDVYRQVWWAVAVVGSCLVMVTICIAVMLSRI